MFNTYGLYHATHYKGGCPSGVAPESGILEESDGEDRTRLISAPCFSFPFDLD